MQNYTDAFDDIQYMFEESEQIKEELYIDEKIAEQMQNDKMFKKLYTPQLQKALDIFRYLLKNEEISERGQILSCYIIMQIGNHYPAWFYRKQYYQQQEQTQVKQKEITFAKNFIKQSPKGFQSWDYLQYCFEQAPEFFEYKETVQFLKDILDIDSRNYHCWQFRIWMTQKFDLFQQERQFISQEIHKDVTNNSYWNYMYFVERCIDLKDMNRIKNLIEQAKLLLKIDYNNEAAWNYLNSLYDNESIRNEYIDFCKNVLNKNINNRFCLASLIFNLKKTKDKKEIQYKELENYFTQIKEVDKQRKNYWDWIQQQS